MSLSLRDVKKSFDDRPVLNGFSAEIPLTGITFVTGKSGAGKSVVCRLAVGLLRPDSGEVELLGVRVDRAPERELRGLRAKTPYLVQGSALLDWLTLRQNVALATKDAALVESSLARVGLLEIADKLPPDVGPGLRKRAAIARALALSPRYLLLDEPTTGLDPTAAGQVNEVLASLKTGGLGALVVSHDYRSLEAMADRVIVVEGGKAAFHGSREEFFRRRPE